MSLSRFSNEEMEAKRGKWFDNQSWKDLQVITVSYSLPGIFLCPVTLATQCQLSLRDTPAPKPPQVPLAHLAMGPGVPGRNELCPVIGPCLPGDRM